MKAKYKYLDDMLVIETKDIHPNDLFDNNDHLSTILDSIKDHIMKAYEKGVKIRMDVTSSHGSLSSTKYMIKVKNRNLDYLSDIVFDIIDL